MNRCFSMLSGILFALIGLIGRAPEADALGISAEIETAGVLEDGETLTITSLRASWHTLLPEQCVGTVCPIEFVIAVSVDLDPRRASALTLRRDGDLLLTRGAVHLLVSVSGSSLSAVPATLEVEEFSSHLGLLGGIGGIETPGGAPLRPVPNFASAGLLEFDGYLRYESAPDRLLSGVTWARFSAVPEPSTGVLALLGATTLAWRQRRRMADDRLWAGHASLPVGGGEDLQAAP